MKYYIDDIVKDVRIALDEIGINDADFLGTDQNTEGADEADLDTIIKSKIIEALRFCILSADSKLVGPGTTIKLDAGSAQSYGIDLSLEYNEQSETKVVKAVMPENFLRLLYAYIKGWPYAVSKVIDVTDPQYAELMNPVTTGTEQRPAVGMRKYYEAPTTEKMDRFVVELFSTKDNATLNNLQGGISILTEPVIQQSAAPVIPPAPDVFVNLRGNAHLTGTLTVRPNWDATPAPASATYLLLQQNVEIAFTWNKTKGTVEMDFGTFSFTARDTSVDPAVDFGPFDFGQTNVLAEALGIGYGDGPIVSNAATTPEHTTITYGGDTLTLMDGTNSTDAVYYPVTDDNPDPALNGKVRISLLSGDNTRYDFAVDFGYLADESEAHGEDIVTAGRFGYSRAAQSTYMNRGAVYTPPTKRGFVASGLPTWEDYCAQVRQTAQVHVSNFVHLAAGCNFQFDTGEGKYVPTKWTASYNIADLWDDTLGESHPMYFITKDKPVYATMVSAVNNEGNSRDNILTNTIDLSDVQEECYLAIIGVGFNLETFERITYTCDGEIADDDEEETPEPEENDDFETDISAGNAVTSRLTNYQVSGGTSYGSSVNNVPFRIVYDDGRLTVDWYNFRKTHTQVGTPSLVVEGFSRQLSFSGLTPNESGNIVISNQDVMGSLVSGCVKLNGEQFVYVTALLNAAYNVISGALTLDLYLTDASDNRLHLEWVVVQ